MVGSYVNIQQVFVWISCTAFITTESMSFMLVYLVPSHVYLNTCREVTLITVIFRVCMVSLEMIGVCTLSLELFSTLSAGSWCVQILLSPLLARLPSVIEAKVFEHHMSGFINLATSLTSPGSNVI